MSLYSKPPQNPPLDGTITLPETIEFHWQHNVDLPAYVFHKEGKDTNDITEISYLEFGRASHRVASFMNDKIPSVTGRPVVAFMALTDSLVYQAISLGLMKSGFIPFPISPRNTAGAVIHLLMKTSCHYLLTTRTTLNDLLDSVKAELKATNPSYELVIEEVPSLRDIFPKLGVETKDDPFTPFKSNYKPKLDEIAMYLHSSGSTGFPKAIPETHQTLLDWTSISSTNIFKDLTPRLRMAAMHLPPFHTMGIYSQIIFPLLGTTAVAVYPPVVESPESLPTLPTPDNVLDHIQRTKSDALITTPAFLQIWNEEQKSIDILGALRLVAYSGGAVAYKIGEFLVDSGVTLCPLYGGTEFGSPTLPFKRKGDEEDWAYMEFSDRVNIRWVPQGDGTYECQFLTTGAHHLPIENLEDIKGYATSDIFERHPTKDYLWKIVGRADDVLIHSSGEKTVPGPMEDIIMSSPYLTGAIMFGRAHDQPGLLVEPKPTHAINVKSEAEVAQFRNLIWPVIDNANKVAPAFSKLFKEMILITSEDKPLPRAGKGTVMRKLSLKVYNDEIEALYATVESTEATESIEPPKSWDAENVTQWLFSQIQDLNPGKKIGISDDLFEHGFDSLSATILRRRISGALQSLKISGGAKAINQNTLYTYPTVGLLTGFLVDIVSHPNGTRIADSPVAAMEEMIKKYSFVTNTDVTNSTTTVGDGSVIGDRIVVLLTGSTGQLASQVLESLLLKSAIHRVYTFNRPSSSKSQLERHLDRFRDKDLDLSTLKSDKWTPLEGDLAKKDLGLSESVYKELRDSITVIIHASWRLDFNLSLQSFESSIRGTRNLIELGLATGRGPNIKFIFTSSITSTLSWDQTRGPYPEEVLFDARYAVGNGYGESKYVSERIIHTSNLNATSLRIGQISGGLPNGAWATTDWVPILVKSSLELGALPSAHGVVSWTPMDSVANSVVDLVFHVDRLPPAINIVHSHPVPWNEVIQDVADAMVQELQLPKPLPLVSFQEWFSLLEKHGNSLDEADQIKIPALKLRDFFKNLSQADIAVSSGPNAQSAEAGGTTHFAIAQAEATSPTRRGLQPLSKQDAVRWVAYWKGVGLFE